MDQVASWFSFKCLAKLPTLRETSRGIHNSKHYWVPELSLHTEPVSGFRAVSAVSAAPRFARGQCYLKSLALGARSCSFAIPNSVKNLYLRDTKTKPYARCVP